MQISNRFSKPQIFNHPMFGNVRAVELNGKPYFVGVDVARALEYANPSKAVISHCRGITKLGIPHRQENQHGFVGESIQETNIIPEGDVYRLIVKAADQSRNQEIRAKAEQFEHWIFEEVLPTIRKTGSYDMIPRTLPEALRLAADLAEKNEALRLENAQKEIIISQLQPKARYVDQILKSKATVTITQIAKDYGLTGTELNKILHEEGVQYKVNKQWVLYKKHADSGYTKSETIDIVRSNGEPDVTMVTKWTQKGRLFIHEILAKRNIVPYMDRKVTA
ncbi:hypothetical protein PACILC2_00920 [Paenibacillus cisolokensis]|uniref:Bro-N domain-containing protein n=1 Tax=Paenibacillus cisolokensis TaxID=1658519 RepID=A0ABQ4N038_9BACL|nr:phage antirepressor KilAC domain-containing protein [Paenibacillus cisolokensis]GIQ61524.1 hypothetical protein PACILC2_00920 [Paenibacillus cisolokensis]